MSFTVTDDQLYNQLADGSATEGDHQLWLDSNMLILTEDGPRPAQQAVRFLTTGQWALAFTTCRESSCIRLDHLTDSKAQADQAKDEELMLLVQRSSVSLASLYKKGKARGLLSARSAYQ